MKLVVYIVPEAPLRVEGEPVSFSMEGHVSMSDVPQVGDCIDTERLLLDGRPATWRITKRTFRMRGGEHAEFAWVLTVVPEMTDGS